MTVKGIGRVAREPHLIVMPESKLWIGPYVNFVHAFAGMKRQAEPDKWFIVNIDWTPPGWQKLDPWEGWMKLAEPHPHTRQPKLKIGRPCKRGHPGVRYADSRNCRDCRIERWRTRGS